MSENMKPSADVFQSAFKADVYYYLREENGAVQVCFDFSQGEYSLDHLAPMLKALKAKFGAPLENPESDPFITYGGRNVGKIYNWLTGSFPQKETTSMQERVWLKEAFDEAEEKYAFKDLIPTAKPATPKPEKPVEKIDTPVAPTPTPTPTIQSPKEKKKKPDYSERLIKRTMKEIEATPTVAPQPQAQGVTLKPLFQELAASTPVPHNIPEMMQKLRALQEQVVLLSPEDVQVSSASKLALKKEKADQHQPKTKVLRFAKVATAVEPNISERVLGKARVFLQDAETEITHAHPRKRGAIYREYVEQLMESLAIDNQIHIDSGSRNDGFKLELRQPGRIPQKEWSSQIAKITETLRLLLGTERLRCLYGHIKLPALNDGQSATFEKFQQMQQSEKIERA